MNKLPISPNNNLSNSRKIVQVTTDDHGFSLGYDADNGLYTLVDLTRFYLVSKSDLNANKLVNTMDQKHSISIGYDDTDGLYAVVDLTRIKISST